MRLTTQMFKLIEIVRVDHGYMPDGDSHVIIVHPATWQDIATKELTAHVQGIKREPPGWEVLAHPVVATVYDIPVLTSSNAPERQVHLLHFEQLKENIRRGLTL